jgi:purine-binding chemotaxis protein CheW
MTRGTMTSARHAGGELDLLVMSVGSLRCALRLQDVVEVVRAVAVTPLPGAPPIAEGVIDVRGDLVPVLDLRQRAGQAPRAPSPEDHLVIARAGAHTVALRADGAIGLARVPADDVRGVSGVGHAEHVVGAATLDDGLVVVTDVARFLSAAESGALDAALRRARVRRAGER